MFKLKNREFLYLNSIISMLLVIILCLSSTFSSFASNLGGNIGNNDTTSGKVGIGGDLGVDNVGDKSRTGLRFSLVDSANPEKIVSVNMAGEPTVIDLWFMSKDKFMLYVAGNTITNLTSDHYFSAVKTQSIDTVNNYVYYTWSDVEASGLFEGIKANNWIKYNNSTNEFVATGKDFQHWEEMPAKVDYDDGTEDTLMYGNIINILDKWRDAEGNLIFGTADSRKAGKTVTDITVPSNKDWKLLIEPITMFTPCLPGTSTPVTTKVAGTLSNIAEYWMQDEALLNLDKKYGANSHLNWKFFNKAAIHSLGVVDSVTQTQTDKEMLSYENGILTGITLIIKQVLVNNNVAHFKDGRYLSKPSLSAVPKMSELAALNKWQGNEKSGFAVNVFSLDGLIQSGTHTWNKSKYPDGEPGEAPDSKYVSEEENFVKVVKYYEDSKDAGATYETVGIYGKDKCLHTITIEDEPQYKVKEFFFSTDANSFISTGTSPSYEEQKAKYDDLGVKGLGACSVEITKPATVLHILYQKADINSNVENNVKSEEIILYQNELSRPYDLSSLTENNQLISLYEKFPNKSGLEKTCHSSHDLDDDCRGNDEDGYWCDGHHTRPAYSNQTDGNYSLSVADNYDYNSNTSFIRDYVVSDNSLSGSIGLAGGETEHFSPNASYLFYRNSQKDKVTLYPEKNSAEIKNRLTSFNIASEAYQPSGTRAAKTSQSDAGNSFKDSLVTHFEDSTTDRELKYDYECDFGHNFDEKSYSSDQQMLIDSMNKSYSKENNALTEYYVGEVNSGLNKPSDVRTDAFMKKYDANTSYALAEADLKFYPALKMKLLEKDDSVKDVYVTSENLSTMKVFNAVQFGVYKKQSPNVNLSSTQWSTHKKSLNFLQNNNIKDKKSVLPGGAILDVDLGNKGDFEVGVRSYQACLPDEQVKKVADQSSFSTSLTKAKEQSEQLFKDVKQSLEGYGLEMYVYDGVTSDNKELTKRGRAVHSGDTVKFGNRGVQLSKDDKYYLRQDGKGANRANFDVLDSKIVRQSVYTIKSDADGNVILYKDYTEIARATKTQNASVMLANTEIKLLDDNTKLVTNFFSAIDRNKGLDKEKQHWYNEMFEGVSVLVTDSTYTIGFKSDSAVRSTVLDVKLLGEASSKSDLYSFADGDVRSLAFYTTENTTSAREPNKSVGYLATLEGFGVMEPVRVEIGKVLYFAYTKIFYINNFSVSDLN